MFYEQPARITMSQCNHQMWNLIFTKVHQWKKWDHILFMLHKKKDSYNGLRWVARGQASVYYRGLTPPLYEQLMKWLRVMWKGSLVLMNPQKNRHPTLHVPLSTAGFMAPNFTVLIQSRRSRQQAALIKSLLTCSAPNSRQTMLTTRWTRWDV